MNLTQLVSELQVILKARPEFAEAEVSFEYEGLLFPVKTLDIGFKKNQCFRTENSFKNWLHKNDYDSIEQANSKLPSEPQITQSVAINAF